MRFEWSAPIPTVCVFLSGFHTKKLKLLIHFRAPLTPTPFIPGYLQGATPPKVHRSQGELKQDAALKHLDLTMLGNLNAESVLALYYRTGHGQFSIPGVEIRKRRSGCIGTMRWLILAISTVSFVIFTMAMSLHNKRAHLYNRNIANLAKVLERDGLCSSRGLPSVTFNDTVIRLCQELNQSLQYYYRLQPERVNPFPYNFIVLSPHICDESTDILVLIHSLHDHSARRTAVRETWGRAASRKDWPNGQKITANIRIAFVFGIHPKQTWNRILMRESEHYGDVIQGDFLEHYHNMTLKSQLALKWASEQCAGVKYVIKSDDDMIINFPELLRVLESTNMERAIMGPLNPQSLVTRSGKWAISKKEFPFYYFPPYESGSAYIISGDIIKKLFEASEHVPPMFNWWRIHNWNFG